MVAMSRQALFEAAWARPLTEIAEDIGITSTGLKKICDRHDIPTPGRGYWAQVRAGKTFPRPKLRPAKSPTLEQVHIQGARALPPAVAAAIQKARDASPRLKARREPPVPTPMAPPEDPDGALAPDGPDAGRSLDATAPPLPKILEPTRKAIARARLDSAGFGAASGAGVIPLRVGPAARSDALAFLVRLLQAASDRGWRLEPQAEGAVLLVDDERITFRLEEQPAKTRHQPTPKELAMKKDRDRWGGDSQTWPTWDFSPSGRLALVIEENDYSGLRRTYSQRKGYAFADSLDVILIGFAGHAALKLARRLEAEAQAKAAAIAKARRERLEAFDAREKRRAEFAAAIGACLAERGRLQAVLDHLETSSNADAGEVPGLADWLRRRLKAIEARVGPHALEISARHAEVDFREPPQTKPASPWYSPIELHLWAPAEGEGRVQGVSELEWAILEGLVVDPGAAPGEGDEPAAETPYQARTV